MAEYLKMEVVEARKYEGPRLTVINDALGEQIAFDGDYLLGTEKGKISVVSKAKFESEYKPYSAAPEADELEAEKAKNADLAGQIDSLSKSNASLGSEVEQLTAEKLELAAKVDAQTNAQAQIDSLTEQLAAANAKADASAQELVIVSGHLKALQDAQAIIANETHS